MAHSDTTAGLNDFKQQYKNIPCLFKYRDIFLYLNMKKKDLQLYIVMIKCELYTWTT